jgi:hypothetical protein
MTAALRRIFSGLGGMKWLGSRARDAGREMLRKKSLHLSQIRNAPQQNQTKVSNAQVVTTAHCIAVSAAADSQDSGVIQNWEKPRATNLA